MNPELMIATAAELNPELAERMQFILELDRLKNVLRKNVLADGSRHENSAEHSWHLAMTAMVMAPHARTDIQLDKVIKMLLVHDVIEIDAGDVDIFDVQARADNEANEQRAAERIFGLLPEPHASELKALWEEFEARKRQRRNLPIAVTGFSRSFSIWPSTVKRGVSAVLPPPKLRISTAAWIPDWSPYGLSRNTC